MPFDMDSDKWKRKPQQPDLDEIFKKFEKLLSYKSFTFFAIAGIILALWLVSCFYTVGVNEVGVVQRFGKYVRTTTSGLNVKLPAGIEKVTKVKTKYVYKEEFGLRTIEAGKRTKYAPANAYLAESLMLTGDLNVAVVPWIVQFRIKDPLKFLFKVRDVRNTLRDLSEATMTLVAGDRSINEVISKREEMADLAKTILQEELDKAETGIQIVTIEMKKTNVPDPVQPSFNEVNQAVQEKEKMIYQAREQYNKAIPAARGEAEKVVRAAEGYALDRVNRARGDAERFVSMYEEYTRAKDVTRRRLYLEAAREFLPRLGKKFIVDDKQENLLPLLNMGGASTPAALGGKGTK